MYICQNCGYILKNPGVVPEFHDELEGSPLEIIWGCPYCKSTNVDEAVRCDICGEYVTSDYVRLLDGTIACNKCYTLY